jgi:putative acetyltransferase
VIETPTIRQYREDDAPEVGRLIERTFAVFNLGFASPEEQNEILGPFQFAESSDPAHRTAISQALEAPLVLVAEQGGSIAGVLRGGRVDRRERTVLQSLFVDGPHHRRGIGRQLVETFEATCRDRGVTRIKVASTLLAVPFYQALGYGRSTGVRRMGSGATSGLIYQPMIKVIA